MRRRNRFTMILVMPLVVLIWVIGWSLFWLGSNKGSAAPIKRAESRPLAFSVVMPEQTYAEQ
jgi:flagellar basal body-associated protein FliL